MNRLRPLKQFRGSAEPLGERAAAEYCFSVYRRGEYFRKPHLRTTRSARRAIAAHLQALGMEGERALLLYPPGLDFIAGFFGCLYAGCTAVPAYPPRRNRNMLRIASIAEDATARCALTIGEVTQRSDDLLQEAPSLRKLEWVSSDRIDSALAVKWSPPILAARDLAVLQYTSGSTGLPKGVMLSHACLINNSILIAFGFEPSKNGMAASGCLLITTWGWWVESSCRCSWVVPV